jgi:hypothetical protein
MTRYTVLLKTQDPLRGLCPACDQPIDDGCKITKASEVTSDPNGTGIRLVLDVECEGPPAYPVAACPCCARETTGS